MEQKNSLDNSKRRNSFHNRQNQYTSAVLQTPERRHLIVSVHGIFHLFLFLVFLSFLFIYCARVKWQISILLLFILNSCQGKHYGNVCIFNFVTVYCTCDMQLCYNNIRTSWARRTGQPAPKEKHLVCSLSCLELLEYSHWLFANVLTIHWNPSGEINGLLSQL